MEGCGGYAGNLIEILSEPLAALPPVINDIGLGANSPYGYKAWAKSDDLSAYVRGTLRSIASARPLKDIKPDPYVSSAPRFACVTPSTVHLYPFLHGDPFLRCMDPGGGAVHYYGEIKLHILMP